MQWFVQIQNATVLTVTARTLTYVSVPAVEKLNSNTRINYFWIL